MTSQRQLTLIIFSFTIFNYISVAQARDWNGKFKLKWGDEKAPSSSVIEVNENFESIAADHSIKTKGRKVEVSGKQKYLEITDFSPPISGLGIFNAILTHGNMVDAHRKNVGENQLREYCSVQYILGKSTDVKYADTIYAMRLGEMGSSPDQYGSYNIFHHSFRLNSATHQIKRSDGYNSKLKTKVTFPSNELKYPYFIKSIKISCKENVLIGVHPVFLKFGEPTKSYDQKHESIHSVK